MAAKSRPRPPKARARVVRELALRARRHPFIAELERGLRRCGLDLAHRESSVPTTIIVGVSGGPDSVALLLGLLAIYKRRDSKFDLIAVHVHHHLRETADADARFVQRLCAEFGIQLRIEHVHPSTKAGNLMAAARELRYEALCRVAHDAGARHIAVAHHGEDQLETMLAALCRGAGLDGMSGMPWSGPTSSGIALIRPLLGVRKCDCEEFCRAAGVRWRRDPSNMDATKTRARLRRDVMPVLEELWPDAARRVSATGESIRAARLALLEDIEGAFGPPSSCVWGRKALTRLDIPLLSAGLRRAALHAAPGIADELNQRHLAQAAEIIVSADRKPRRLDWPGGLQLKVTSKSVSISC